MTDTLSISERIAAHIFDVGSFLASARPARIAFKVIENPSGREHENGGLCESALVRVINESLKVDQILVEANTPLLARKLHLVEIPLEPFPDGRMQRKTSEDDRIKGDSSYLVKIGGCWFASRFNHQWYGWNFEGWGTSGMQLDMIEGPLYEIVEDQG